MRFVETKLCNERKHCMQCRTREGGRKWRTLINRVYGADGVDFACPVQLLWLTDNPSAADLEPFQNIRQGIPGRAVRVPSVARVDARAIGNKLVGIADQLRRSLNPESPVIQALDALAEAEAIKGGCKGCRRKRYVRAVGAALSKCTDREQNMVKALALKG